MLRSICPRHDILGSIITGKMPRTHRCALPRDDFSSYSWVQLRVVPFIPCPAGLSTQSKTSVTANQQYRAVLVGPACNDLLWVSMHCFLLIPAFSAPSSPAACSCPYVNWNRTALLTAILSIHLNIVFNPLRDSILGTSRLSKLHVSSTLPLPHGSFLRASSA